MKKLLAVIILLSVLCGCHSRKMDISEDEFVIQIRLETDDSEICVMDMLYSLDGEGMGGLSVSNADNRTPLKGDYYFHYDPQYFPEGAELDGFSTVILVQYDFSKVGVVGDLSSAELVTPEIVFSPEKGCLYRVVVTGSREKGYSASFEGKVELD